MEDIIKDLVDRGLLDSFSDQTKVSEMLQTKQTIYCGFDPSAESLQLGNYVMITILRRLQNAGHRIIALIGGGTGMIGDPSGKKSERGFLDAERVNHNVDCIKKQLSLYLDFSNPEKGILLNNGDWWNKIPVVEYLREYGKAFSINYMLNKDVIASRMDTGISYTEFSYMVLQSADFYRLYKEYGCALQIGGGDQWGNLTASLELIRKKENQATAEVFSVKLITDSEGRKFGKSERGALYLNPDMCSPYFIYQYFINVSDIDVARYMRIFDDRDLVDIQKDIDEHMECPERRLGQKKLAYLIVAQLHSEKVANDCINMSEALFKNDFSKLEEKQIIEVAEGIKQVKLDAQEISLLDALIELGLAKSRREAREFVAAGSVRVNGEKQTDIDSVLKNGEGLYKTMFIIRRGKKSYALLQF